MKPFNLEEALQGKPFTNDKGWTVEDWHCFKSIDTPIVVKWKEKPLLNLYDESDLFMVQTIEQRAEEAIQHLKMHTPEELTAWSIIHLYIDHLKAIHRKESELFMLPEKKKVWIVVYKKDGYIQVAKFQSLCVVHDFIKTIACDQHLETIEKEYEL
jgi:hypothetical protein